MYKIIAIKYRYGIYRESFRLVEIDTYIDTPTHGHMDISTH